MGSPSITTFRSTNTTNTTNTTASNLDRNPSRTLSTGNTVLTQNTRPPPFSESRFEPTSVSAPKPTERKPEEYRQMRWLQSGIKGEPKLESLFNKVWSDSNARQSLFYVTPNDLRRVQANLDKAAGNPSIEEGLRLYPETRRGPLDIGLVRTAARVNQVKYDSARNNAASNGGLPESVRPPWEPPASFQDGLPAYPEATPVKPFDQQKFDNDLSAARSEAERIRKEVEQYNQWFNGPNGPGPALEQYRRDNIRP